VPYYTRSILKLTLVLIQQRGGKYSLNPLVCGVFVSLCFVWLGGLKASVAI